VTTSDVIAQASQTSVRTWQTRLRGYVVRRTRQLARLLLVLTIGLLITAAVLEGWRGVSLIGLPDVGDPFDVVAFRAFRVREDQDAILLLRQAHEKLTPMPGLPGVVLQAGPVAGWSKAAPELRDWVMANRGALEMFRNAADRPDVNAGFGRDRHENYLNLGKFIWLALLEASRHAEQGDMAQAWSWYRAVIRFRVHVMRRGSLFQRFVVDGNSSSLEQCIANWIADRRTSVSLVRRALDDVRAAEPKPEWDGSSLRVEYLEKMKELDKDWGWVQQGEDKDQHVRIGDGELPPYLGWIPYAAKRYISSEPERSRRVMRLAFANWLAHAEDRDPRHKKPAARVTFKVDSRSLAVCFYPVNAAGPVAAQKLNPQELARWFAGSRDAKVSLDFWPWPGIHTSERRKHHALAMLLAGELYKRDLGKPPPSDESLVGPYLDHLPGDGSDELDDGSVPTIVDGEWAPAAKPG
jgi:hypothetical protein